MRKNAYFSSAVLSAAVVAALSSCGSEQQQMQAPVPSIATITVEPGMAEMETAHPATIKGKTDIDIRPQVTGFITKVHVDEGQRVRKGQLLFTIDQVQYQAAVDQAQAAVNLAKTAVETARITAENNRMLNQKNIISDYARQLSDNDLATAKASLAQAEAALVTAKKNLAYTQVVAPSDGVVGSIPNREGSLASPSGQALTTVSDNNEVYAYFSLTEKDILNLTNGGSVTLDEAVAAMPAVKLRLANGSVYPVDGKVATVSGVIDSSTGAANVRALFKNTNGMLRSGSTGQVLIPDVRQDVIIVPQKSTFEIQDRKFVYVVNDSNKVASVPVSVVDMGDGRSYVVESGLQKGQRVVIEGVGTKVKDGSVINPVDPAAAAQQQQPQQ